MDNATREFYEECAEREGKTLEQWLKEAEEEWNKCLQTNKRV